MKTSVWLFLLGSLAFSAHASSYVFTDIGALSTRDRMAAAHAYAINASGTISAATDTFGAFLYDGSVHPLPGDAFTSALYALNDQGQGAGFLDVVSAGVAYSHAARYSNGSMQDLGTLGGISSSASGINSAGNVVGTAFTTGNDSSHAFLYQGGTMIDLGTLGGVDSSAAAINDAGQIVGTSDRSNGAQHAFLYQDGTMADLGAFSDGWDSFAVAINNAGQIIGNANDPTGNLHAFIYSGGNMNRLMQEDVASYAGAINASGDVVGTFRDAKTKNAFHVFLYSKGRTVDLQTLLPTDSRWKLETAVGINDAGQIIGDARVYFSRTRSAVRAYLLTPAALAPKIRLKGSASFTTSQSAVAIRGSSSGSVANLNYYKDGNTSRAYPIAGRTRWNFRAHLKHGKNTFTIRAHGSRGDSLPLVVTVVRD